jgi:hypothetical protein
MEVQNGDSTKVRRQSQAAGAKGGLPIRVLVSKVATLTERLAFCGYYRMMVKSDKSDLKLEQAKITLPQFSLKHHLSMLP